MNHLYIGSQIRKYRKQLGRTQEWLAEQAEISVAFVGHIERGTRKASIETLAHISIALHTTLDSLVLPPRCTIPHDQYTKDQLQQAQKLLEAAIAMSKQ